jgi:hypothetical protein
MTYNVPDSPYIPEPEAVKKDRFEGYRALSEDDYVLWQNALDDANA